MLKFVLGAFLVAHGLIHWSLATVPTPKPGELNTPFWPSWWRNDSNSAWLVTAMGLDRAAVRAFGALLWMAATAGFVAAGLGVMGVPVLHDWWRPLAVASVVASLPLFVLFWHPWLVVGAALDVAIMVLLLWVHWPSTDAIGA